jgi:hypothetical protein
MQRFFAIALVGWEEKIERNQVWLAPVSGAMAMRYQEGRDIHAGSTFKI